MQNISILSQKRNLKILSSLKESLRLSPRASPSPFISPPRSPVQNPSIDPVQQEIYDYIKSLERKEATTKEPIQSLEEGSNQFNEPHEPPASNVLKQEIFDLETLNRYINIENQMLKAQNGIQIAKSDNLILHLSPWYKNNKKLKKENKAMKREIINLKYKILIRKPRMAVTAKKKKKKVKFGCAGKGI